MDHIPHVEQADKMLQLMNIIFHLGVTTESVSWTTHYTTTCFHHNPILSLIACGATSVKDSIFIPAQNSFMN